MLWTLAPLTVGSRNFQESDLLLSGLRESVRFERKQNRAVSYGIIDRQTVKWSNIADGGYRGELAGNITNTFGYVLQVIISGYKKQGFSPIKGR